MKIYHNLLSLTLLLCGLTDFIRVVQLGGITALGMLTILLAPITWILVFSYSKMPKVVLVVSWLVLFLLFGLTDWLWYYSTLPPVLVIQNLSVYVAFVGFIILSIIQCDRDLDIPEYISKTLPKAIKVSVGLYGLSILLSGPGNYLIMGARSFALFAIIGVAWFLAVWRYRLTGGVLWSTLTILAIAFSFSRTALLISLVLFPLSQISLTSLKSWLRIGLTLTLIVTVSYLAFTYVEPIRSRFTETGDNAIVGGVQVNTSGRNLAWPILYASALESPWIGKGPSSAGIVASQRIGASFVHPHNDYLRIFHDYGLVGLILWVVGYWGLIFKTWQNWHWADRNDKANAHIHLAAFLALIAVALAMISDNVVIYIFSMAPLGILVGASLGIGSRRQKLIKTNRIVGSSLPLVRELSA